MKDSMLLEYNLNEELWRRFFEAHYRRQGFFRWRYFYGVLLVVIGAYMLGGAFANKLVGAGFVASGLYCVLSKQLFIIKSLASARKGPLFTARIAVELSAEGVKVTSGSQRSERPWNAFRGYCLVAPGVMLYLDQNAFFFIPKEALTETTAGLLQRCLEQSGLKQL